MCLTSFLGALGGTCEKEVQAETWRCFRCQGDDPEEEATAQEVLGIYSNFTEGCMTEEQKTKRKAAQAIAHKKWRESEKGKAYYAKLKLKKAGVDVVNIEGGEVTVK